MLAFFWRFMSRKLALFHPEILSISLATMPRWRNKTNDSGLENTLRNQAVETQHFGLRPYDEDTLFISARVASNDSSSSDNNTTLAPPSNRPKISDTRSLDSGLDSQNHCHSDRSPSPPRMEDNLDQQTSFVSGDFESVVSLLPHEQRTTRRTSNLQTLPSPQIRPRPPPPAFSVSSLGSSLRTFAPGLPPRRPPPPPVVVSPVPIRLPSPMMTSSPSSPARWSQPSQVLSTEMDVVRENYRLVQENKGLQVMIWKPELCFL